MNAIDNHDDRTSPVDDLPFRSPPARATRRRSFEVSTADSAAAGSGSVRRQATTFAVPRLEDGNGIDLVGAIRDERPDSRTVTGCAGIATAVAAVKAKAVDRLAKLTGAVEAALPATGPALPPLSRLPLSAERARWERIPRGCEQCDLAGRRPGRRTMQRLLAKRAPRETDDA